MHPIITIFCPFTRRWAIDKWLEDLAGVEHDPALTNLCAIIDMEELYIRNQLRKFAEARGYRSFHVKMNEGHHPVETNIKTRRGRIAEIHEQAKDLVAKCDGDIVIGLEDDTRFDRLESFARFVKPFTENWKYTGKPIGMIQGVQMGRWGARMIGAWWVDNPRLPTHAKTLLPPTPELQQEWEETKLPNGLFPYQAIHGGGWYGYATTKRLFLDAPYFDSPSVPWGPDVEFGLWLQQQGFVCYIDWSILFGHRDHGETMYPDDPRARLTEVVYNKNPDTGKWEREDHERRG